MARSRVRFHEAALREALTGPAVARAVRRAGREIAADARDAAPRGGHTGKHGADSIRSVGGEDQQGPYARVSWGKKWGFHMRFQEFGTSRVPARAFLRSAAFRRRSF